MYHQLQFVRGERGEIVIRSLDFKCSIVIGVTDQGFRISGLEEPNHGRQLITLVPRDEEFHS